MYTHIADTVDLSNGIKMPVLGLGTYKTSDGPEVELAVRSALETGYRSIDTASFYDNETGVGRAVRASGIPREELFITTKVWNSEQGYDDTLRAFDRSRVKLATEYIDLYLIHWPVRGIYPETWRALEDLCRKGLARAIGVCNFKEHHLETLLGRCEIAPMVNQFELHPRLLQPGLVEYCRGRSIVVEAWAPLMRGMLAGNDLVLEISEKHRKTPAQVIIRWDLQHGFVTIPKSVHPERILENSMVFDFELTAGEMRQIDSLDRGERIGPDPDSFV